MIELTDPSEDGYRSERAVTGGGLASETDEATDGGTQPVTVEGVLTVDTLPQVRLTASQILAWAVVATADEGGAERTDNSWDDRSYSTRC